MPGVDSNTVYSTSYPFTQSFCGKSISIVPHKRRDNVCLNISRQSDLIIEGVKAIFCRRSVVFISSLAKFLLRIR